MLGSNILKSNSCKFHLPLSLYLGMDFSIYRYLLIRRSTRRLRCAKQQSKPLIIDIYSDQC